MIVFCDIDGTIADNTHRKHFIECLREEQDWDEFYNPYRVSQDTPIAVGIGLARFFSKAKGFYFLTGRPERLRQTTTDWLGKHFDLAGSPLLMRGDRDWSKATSYKEKQIIEMMQRHPGEPAIFIDDDDRNTPIYNRHGIFLKAPECWSVIR